MMVTYVNEAVWQSMAPKPAKPSLSSQMKAPSPGLVGMYPTASIVVGSRTPRSTSTARWPASCDRFCPPSTGSDGSNQTTVWSPANCAAANWIWRALNASAKLVQGVAATDPSQLAKSDGPRAGGAG